MHLFQWQQFEIQLLYVKMFKCLNFNLNSKLFKKNICENITDTICLVY